MKRRVGLSRSGSPGKRARHRVRSGGVLSKGRESATKAEWLEIVKAIRLRANDKCEIFRSLQGTDPAHIQSRSARGWRSGGVDATWNVLWLSRYAHNLESRPYNVGRLIYRFVDCNNTRCCRGQEEPRHVRWIIERRERKGAPLIEELASGVIDLAVPTVNEPARL